MTRDEHVFRGVSLLLDMDPSESPNQPVANEADAEVARLQADLQRASFPARLAEGINEARALWESEPFLRAFREEAQTLAALAEESAFATIWRGRAVLVRVKLARKELPVFGKASEALAKLETEVQALVQQAETDEVARARLEHYEHLLAELARHAALVTPKSNSAEAAGGQPLSAVPYFVGAGGVFLLGALTGLAAVGLIGGLVVAGVIALRRNADAPTTYSLAAQEEADSILRGQVRAFALDPSRGGALRAVLDEHPGLLALRLGAAPPPEEAPHQNGCSERHAKPRLAVVVETTRPIAPVQSQYLVQCDACGKRFSVPTVKGASGRLLVFLAVPLVLLFLLPNVSSSPEAGELVAMAGVGLGVALGGALLVVQLVRALRYGHLLPAEDARG